MFISYSLTWRHKNTFLFLLFCFGEAPTNVQDSIHTKDRNMNVGPCLSGAPCVGPYLSGAPCLSGWGVVHSMWKKDGEMKCKQD